MKYLIAAILLAFLILKVAGLLPAEAAGKRIAAGSPAWQSAASRDGEVAAASEDRRPSLIPGAARGQVVVSAQIVPVRLLVTDEEGNLTQIWSNGGEPGRLEARQFGRNGPEVTVGDALRAAYDRVAPTIPPDARGLVYQRP